MMKIVFMCFPIFCLNSFKIVKLRENYSEQIGLIKKNETFGRMRTHYYFIKFCHYSFSRYNFYSLSISFY